MTIIIIILCAVCRFHVLLGLGEEEDATPTTVPGNALVVDPKKQFRPLSKFGNAFLNRFQVKCASV